MYTVSKCSKKVYGSIIYITANMKGNKMFINKIINALWCIQIIGYSTAILRNKVLLYSTHNIDEFYTGKKGQRIYSVYFHDYWSVIKEYIGGGGRGEKWPKPCMHIWIIKEKE
jgi:hypothetical protein